MHRSYDFPLVYLLVGALLLLFGRNLFWLFIAAAGFAVGIELAHAAFPHQPEIFLLLAALSLGLLGAILAIFVQKLAIGIAGFFAGGYLAATLYASVSGPAHPEFSWLLFLIGGMVGAILMVAFFNWALIILSSLQGAHLILSGLTFRHDASILFVVLAVAGIALQASTYRRPKSPA